MTPHSSDTRSTYQVKTTATLFEIEDPVATRAWQRVAPVVVEATEDDVTGVAGIALLGELLDHLGLVEVANPESSVRWRFGALR